MNPLTKLIKWFKSLFKKPCAISQDIKHAYPHNYFIVCPGYIVSKYDGDEHFINAQMLIALFGVNPKHCKVVGPYNDHFPASWPELHPKYDGNYSLDPYIRAFVENSHK